MFNFCPMCGADIRSQRKLCHKCHLDLRAYKKKLDDLAAQFADNSTTPVSEASQKLESLPAKTEKLPVTKTETKSEVAPEAKKQDAEEAKIDALSDAYNNFEAYNKALADFKSEGIDIEDVSAAEWLKKGYMLSGVRDMLSDVRGSLKLYKEAEKLGSIKAIHSQFEFVFLGIKDAITAISLLKKAAEKENPESMFQLGRMYLLGTDVVPESVLKKDVRKGFALLEKASANYVIDADKTLALYAEENPKYHFYCQKLIANNVKGKEAYSLNPKNSYNEKKGVFEFQISHYILSFNEITLKMAEISSKINLAQEFALDELKKFYNEEGNIQGVVSKSKNFGLYILKGIADIGIAALTDLGRYDVTADDIVYKYSYELKDATGLPVSIFSEDIPSEIWENYNKRVQDFYFKIVQSAQSERDRRQFERENRARWHGTYGSNFGDYLSNKMKAGMLNLMEGAVHRAINGIGDIGTNLSQSSNLESFYKNNSTFSTYYIGLLKAIEALRLRIFVMMAGKIACEKIVKAKNILENLNKTDLKYEKAEEMSINALLMNPYDIKIYEYILRKFGDPNCDLECIATAMTLQVEVLQLKKEILHKRLKSNPNCSNELKKILDKDDIVLTLSNLDYDTLKSDYKIIFSEIYNLQPQIADNSKLGQIIDVYKNIIESKEKDKSSKNRIKTFEYAGQSMDYFEIPEGVTEIGSYAFANCKNLKEIKFPSTLKKIEQGAFYNCPFVTLDLPKGVIEVSVNLTNEDTIVYLPKSVETMTGNYMITSNKAKFAFDFDSFIRMDFFDYHNELISVSTKEEIKKNYDSIQKTLNTNVGMLDDFSDLIKNLLMLQPEKVRVGLFSDKEIFGDDEFVVNAFFARYVYGCFKATNIKEIHFGSYLRKISHSAFYNCQNLEKLILPNGTEYLGNYICVNCKKLKFLFIPDTVKHIGEDILSGTNAVVYCSPESYAAEYCRKNNIPFKDSAVESYKTAKELAESSTNAEEMEKAFVEFVESVEMGSIDAAYEVGKCYLYKLGVNVQDVSKAVGYFEKAAKAGHKDAMFELYKIYNKGGGSIAQDTFLAQQWLERSGHDAKEAEMPIIISSSKIIKGYEETLNYREKLFEKYGDIPCIYFPEKSQKSANKINNAINAYAGRARDEIVILLCDVTLFGSATDGFLITNKAIYYHNLGEEIKRRVDFEDIISISYDETNVLIEFNIIEDNNFTIKIFTSTTNPAQMSRIMTEIKETLLE